MAVISKRSLDKRHRLDPIPFTYTPLFSVGAFFFFVTRDFPAETSLNAIELSPRNGLYSFQ